MQTLIDAAERLVERRHHQRLELRQVAAEAGMTEASARDIVRDEQALCDALADNASTRLIDSISRRTVSASATDPHAQIWAMAQGFLEWAISRPAEFLMIADRNLIDLASTPALRRLNDSIHVLLNHRIAEAQDQGKLSADYDVNALALIGRATIYGLARMVTDGHLKEWTGEDHADPYQAVESALGAALAATPRNWPAQDISP